MSPGHCPSCPPRPPAPSRPPPAPPGPSRPSCPSPPSLPGHWWPLRHSVALLGPVEPVSKCIGWWPGPRLGLRKLRSSLLLWSDLGQEKPATLSRRLTPAGAACSACPSRSHSASPPSPMETPFSAARPSVRPAGTGRCLMALQAGLIAASSSCILPSTGPSICPRDSVLDAHLPCIWGALRTVCRTVLSSSLAGGFSQTPGSLVRKRKAGAPLALPPRCLGWGAPAGRRPEQQQMPPGHTPFCVSSGDVCLRSLPRPQLGTFQHSPSSLGGQSRRLWALRDLGSDLMMLFVNFLLFPF